MAASKKRRTSSRAQTLAAGKRNRKSAAPAPAPAPLENERVAGVPFPPQIRALPHVLKLINAFLKVPDAAWLAVTSNQATWLEPLFVRYGINVASPEMLTHAAAKGYEEVVKVLLKPLSTYSHKSYKTRWNNMLSAVVAAGADRQLATLKILLQELRIEVLRSDDNEVVCAEIEKALSEAAARGYMDVVAFVVQHAKEKFYAHFIGKGSRALSRAITGGHTDVSEFLLKLDGFDWDLPHSFATAVSMKQTALAMKIYDECPEYDGKNLFVCLARDGYAGAVEFLYPKVCGNVELLNAACLEASKGDQSGVLTILLATGRIPPDTIAQAFVVAACDGKSSVVHLLDDHQISSETVGIPPDTIAQAFVVAACHGKSSVVQYLLDNHQLSSETVGEGFISAANGNHYCLMQALYMGQQISAEVVLQAFKNTTVHTDLQTVKCLIGFLSDEPRIPREFKHKAFVDAASTDKTRALQQLTKRGHEELPLEVLREAHAAASSINNTKKVVCRVTCEQLFDVNRKGRFDAMAKLMAEWKEESTGKKDLTQRRSKK